MPGNTARRLSWWRRAIRKALRQLLCLWPRGGMPHVPRAATNTLHTTHLTLTAWPLSDLFPRSAAMRLTALVPHSDPCTLPALTLSLTRSPISVHALTRSASLLRVLPLHSNATAGASRPSFTLTRFGSRYTAGSYASTRPPVSCTTGFQLAPPAFGYQEGCSLLRGACWIPAPHSAFALTHRRTRHTAV